MNWRRGGTTNLKDETNRVSSLGASIRDASLDETLDKTLDRAIEMPHWPSVLPWWYWLLVLGLLALGLGLRLYDITDEPLDFHPTRQLRGAIVARGMYYEMLPGADETMRSLALAFWESVGQYEPSILERLVALTYLLIGKEVIWIGQLYNSLFWIIGGLALFALARRLATNTKYAIRNTFSAPISVLIALAYYLALPFGVQASRTIQPDPGMVMWIVLTAYTLYRWSEQETWKWAILAGILGGVATYTKALAAYPVAGIAVALVIYTGLRAQTGQARGAVAVKLKKILLNPQAWVMALLMIVPTAFFYLGKGERISDYLGGWTFEQLLIDPWFYIRWLNAVRQLLGWTPLFLLPLSLWAANARPRALLLGWWGGYLLYGLFLPYQMYTHNYYHLQLVPLAALSVVPITRVVLSRLLVDLSRLGKTWRTITSGVLILLAVAILFCLSWQALIPQRVRDSRSEPAYWQEIASQLPADGKIIALTQDYGYRIMYYGWRKVTLWPNRGELKLSVLRGSEKEFEAYFFKRTEEKSYFLITAFRQFDDQPALKQYLYDHYAILVERENNYIIFDLRQPLSPP